MERLAHSVWELFAAAREYIGFLLIALLGGTAKYIQELRSAKTKKFKIVELLGEWLTSGFTALLMSYPCIHYGMSWEMTAFVCGISGHMGGRLVFILEVLFIKKLEKFFNNKVK
jgi:hypothetical protein